MTLGTIAQWNAIPGLAGHPVWEAAFAWIARQGPDADLGDTPLGLQGFMGRVMQYPTKLREQCVYEAHRRTIDIQVTLEGCEGIEFADERSIVGLGNYATTADVEHFRTPSKGAATVRNVPGRFVIIMPGEPHLPQLALDEGSSPLVRKLVVKVPAALVGVPEVVPTWVIQPLERSAK